jgi:hypothetical protein
MKVFDNPIVIKERQVRKRRLMEKWYRGWSAYALFPAVITAPLLIGYLGLALEGRELHRYYDDILRTVYPIVSFLLILLTCYRATSLTYASFVLEKEKKTYESLIGTLLTPGQLIKGKLFAGLYPLLVEITVFSPLLFIFMAGSSQDSSIHFLQVTALIASMYLFAAFFGLVGVYASLTSPTSMRANQSATAILACFFLLTPIIDGILTWIVDWFTSVHDFLFITSTANPVFMVSSILSATLYPSPGGLFGFIFLVGFAVYGAGIAVLWKVATRRIAAASVEGA